MIQQHPLRTLVPRTQPANSPSAFCFYNRVLPFPSLLSPSLPFSSLLSSLLYSALPPTTAETGAAHATDDFPKGVPVRVRGCCLGLSWGCWGGGCGYGCGYGCLFVRERGKGGIS